MHPDGHSTSRSRRNQCSEAIPIRSRIPVIDWEPGPVAIENVWRTTGTVPYCQYAFMLTVMDVFTEWTIKRAIKIQTAKFTVAAMAEIQDEFPCRLDHIH